MRAKQNAGNTVLYQGTTLVGPLSDLLKRALAPEFDFSLPSSAEIVAKTVHQGLKPIAFAAISARLKSCPDTKLCFPQPV
jgi:hypothetical protein